MAVDSTLSKYTTRSFAFVIALGIFACNPLEAGLFGQVVSGKISFSPDSSKIAFIWSDELSMPYADSPTLRREISIYWCDVASTRLMKSTKVDSVGREYAYDGVPMGFKFSPDSHRLAIFTPNYLSVINLKSKRLSRLTHRGEKVSSFQWLSNDDVGYVVYTKTGEGTEYDERTFWQQKITEGPDTRAKIYHESGIGTGARTRRPIVFGRNLEHWSPKGRYVLFLSSPYGTTSRFKLLDTTKGKVMCSFGQPKSFGSGVSWKLDESEAFCVGGIVGEGANQQAVLIKTATGEVFDCSENFAKTFRARIAPELLPFWTVDGRYVLANDYRKLGPCLIQPRPWKVIEMQKRLAKHIKLHNQYKPHLFRLPVAGWVGINAIGMNKKYATDEAPKFAFDYRAEKVIPLFEDRGWGCVNRNIGNTLYRLHG